MALTTHHFPVATSPFPSVVLLHGFASSAAEDFLVTGWPETLNQAGRSVIAVDLPGHGDSPAVHSAAEALTSQVLTAIIEAVSQHAPEGECDVIGYSLGARLSWDLPTVSPRVRRLLLGGLSPFEPFAAIDQEALQAALAGAPATSPVIGMMAGMITAPGRDTASLLQLMTGLAAEPFEPGAGNGYPQLPTLLVAGESDQMTQGIDQLVTSLPSGTLTRVPGDHRGALDSAEFRAAAIEFLAN